MLASKLLSLSALLLCIAFGSVHASTWNLDANGTWGTAGNWSPVGVPNASGAIADFGSIITADRTVTAGAFTIGEMNFDIPDFIAYTITAGTLTLEGVGEINVALSNRGPHIISSVISLNTNLKIDQASTLSPFTISGVIKNGTELNELIKNGAGTVILSAVNTYTGPTRVNNGILQFTPGGSINGSLVVTSPGSVVYESGGGDRDVETLTGDAAATIVMGAGDFLVVDSGAFAGVISGDGGVRKTTAGTLTFSGKNSYLSETVVDGGLLMLGPGGSILSPLTITGPGAVTLAAGAIQVIGTLTGDATADITLMGMDDLLDFTDGTYAGDIMGPGGITKRSDRVATFTGTNSSTGVLSIEDGEVKVDTGGTLVSPVTINGSGFLTLAAGVMQTLGDLNGGGAGMVLEAASDVLNVPGGSFAGIISGPGALTKRGPDTLTIAAPCTFAGPLTILDGAVVLSPDGFVESALDISATGSLRLEGDATRTILALTGVTGAEILPEDPSSFLRVKSGDYSGRFSGSGRVVKYDPDTLILKDEVDVDVEIEAGRVELDALGSLQQRVEIRPAGTLAFEFSAPTTRTITELIGEVGAEIELGISGNILEVEEGEWQGVMSESGGVRKTTGGIVRFRGTQTFTGPLTIAEGELILVDGASLASSSITIIDPPAIVSGNGTLGPTTNGGVVSPGLSIGTIFFAGDFTQLSTGNLIIEIDQNGNRDQIIVGDEAFLDGTFTLDPEPGLYLAGDSFTFLTAVTAVNSTFATLSSTSPLIFDINYQSNFAQVHIILAGVVTSVPIDSLKGNAKAVAEFLFCSAPTTTDPDLINVMRLLLALPADQFGKNLPQLSPAIFGALPLVNLQRGTIVADTIVENAEKSHWCDRCKGDQKNTAIWIAPVGNLYRQDRIDNQIGFDADTYGFTIGGSHLFCDRVNLSAASGYTYSSIDWKRNAGEGHWNSVYLGPSVAWIDDNWYVNLLLLGSYNHYKIDRKIRFTGLRRTAHNSHDSYDLLARVDGGYKFKVGFPGCTKYLFILPEARLSYLNVFEKRYTESGAGSLNLVVDSKQTAYLQPNLLIKFLQDFYSSNYCITPTLQVGWVANIPLSSAGYRSRLYKQQACKSHYSVNSFHKTTNQLSLGAELVVARLNDLLFELGYKANFFGRSVVHNAKVKVEKRF
ncbi:MAG: Extracellular serine protease [Chlamydiae bacterium]|nr:Extracellular serine protease [Chlamydiota bacterium]